jgi:hypothetical protein
MRPRRFDREPRAIRPLETRPLIEAMGIIGYTHDIDLT